MTTWGHNWPLNCVMTGRNKIFAVMDGRLTSGFPVVIPYPGIFLRDHWDKITKIKWWEVRDGNIEKMIQVEEDLQKVIPLDWVVVGMCPEQDWCLSHKVKMIGNRVYLVDIETGIQEEISFWRPHEQRSKRQPEVKTISEIKKKITITPADEFLAKGRFDYTKAALQHFGKEKFIRGSIVAPFWGLYQFFGFEDMMVNILNRPSFIEKILKRLTMKIIEEVRAYARAGVDGIWIEDAFTSSDLISKAHYRRFAKPYTDRVIKEINTNGMKSILYFCGNPNDRLSEIVSSGCSALSLEESKKGFEIDISKVARIADGYCCLFGNLDSIKLEKCSIEILYDMVKEQWQTGCHYGRFVFSLGSPVTANTDVQKVKAFLDFARNLVWELA